MASCGAWVGVSRFFLGGLHSLKTNKTNIAPENVGAFCPDPKFIFQHPFFRGEHVSSREGSANKKAMRKVEVS